MDYQNQQYHELCNLHLGDDYFLSAKDKDGEIQIHLRQFQRFTKEGKLYPTKKGLYFSPSDWLVFESYVETVDHAFQSRASLTADQRWYIANDIHVTVNTSYPTVDIRRFWKPNGDDSDYVPTKNGVSLNYRRWDALKDVVKILREFIPELDNAAIISNVVPFNNAMQEVPLVHSEDQASHVIDTEYSRYDQMY
ncbi:hypothetical protein FSP39_020814 [Pinctada imbricata]|uniref:Transcriptional coactivator p15 (PC4) C-terminal domain-containing protein n=1 Tax=Pinctada imbricata TaxID=66713 RepID=A0AA88Y6I3_PINIB|nr:hypothetical protein FSP39_020814 [Pinctada imbricata]